MALVHFAKVVTKATRKEGARAEDRVRQFRPRPSYPQSPLSPSTVAAAVVVATLFTLVDAVLGGDAP